MLAVFSQIARIWGRHTIDKCHFVFFIMNQSGLLWRFFALAMKVLNDLFGKGQLHFVHLNSWNAIFNKSLSSPMV